MKEYNVKSRIVPFLSRVVLADEVAVGKLVIASVNPEIIRGDAVVHSRKKSGHLVLVVGVKKVQGELVCFYIHNPSGKSEVMQKYAFIPLKVFCESYGERGIIVD